MLHRNSGVDDALAQAQDHAIGPSGARHPRVLPWPPYRFAARPVPPLPPAPPAGMASRLLPSARRRSPDGGTFP